jgi:hypothetical protein
MRQCPSKAASLLQPHPVLAELTIRHDVSIENEKHGKFALAFSKK